MRLLVRRETEDEYASGAYRNTRVFGPSFPFDDASLAAKLGLLIASGGDERISLDPVTGRTRYGTTLRPAPDEIFFSSSTASTITRRGHAAALYALDRLMSGRTGQRMGVAAWFDSLRARILALYGVPRASAVLAASGTELEYLAQAFARAGSTRPLTNIVVAPQETGSGVPVAALGRHFLSSACLGGCVPAQQPLAGWENASTELATIDLRDAEGRPRRPSDVDAEARDLAERALRAGHDVLLHVLDASKTGLAGMSRDAARAIAAMAPRRVSVVVDACQLRATKRALRADLDAGFMVMITGSKFAGGPPFSGALLLPGERVARFAVHGSLPPGLSAYSAELDWPGVLRPRVEQSLGQSANLGLGLRWEAALAEIEPLMAIPLAHQRCIFSELTQAFVAAVSTRPELSIADGPALRLADGRPRTILPVLSQGLTSLEDARELWLALRASAPEAGRGEAASMARICHVGQPVLIGGQAALRLCISAPMAVDVGNCLAEGRTPTEALAPVRADLDLVLDKWCRLLRARRQDRAA